MTWDRAVVGVSLLVYFATELWRLLPDGTSAAAVVRRVADATQKFWDDAHLDCNWENAEVAERNGKRWLRITKKRASKGRPPKIAVRQYVTRLVAIYEEATGREIKRTYNPYVGKTKQEPFLLACLKIAGIRPYPTAIIREVTEDPSI